MQYDEFVGQVQHRARAVVSVLLEALTPNEVSDLRAQLPDDFEPLLTAGSEGQMET